MQLITETALLQCDKGAITTKLAVTSQNFSLAESKLIATEQDKQANVNIQSFSICSITKKTCIPAPTIWQQTTEKDTINGFKILTENSFCKCSLGGKISIKINGHEGKHSV
jgi:hypothetical protein